MADIYLNPDYTAVKSNQVKLEVYGGWNMTNLKNQDKVIKFRNIKQVYDFTIYNEKNVRISTYKKTVTGNTNNKGYLDDITLNNLLPGKKHKIEVSISYSYEFCQYKSSILFEGWGEWQKVTNVTNDEFSTGTLDVYTRNNKIASDFWGNPSSGRYIDQHITAKNVNEWLEQCEIWKSWKEQYDYSNYFRLWKNPKGDISAAWYNALSEECDGDYEVVGLSEVTDKTKATHIEAEHFINLAEKVTTWK